MYIQTPSFVPAELVMTPDSALVEFLTAEDQSGKVACSLGKFLSFNLEILQIMDSLSFWLEWAAKRLKLM